MHHKLDVHPIPKETLYINEPWLIDHSLLNYPIDRIQPDTEPDNIRVYIPLDLNHKAILRRLYAVIDKYGEANEKNESNYALEVQQILYQIEIYDQIWRVREFPEKGKHSLKAIDLVKDVITLLEDIPDGCAESFPFDTIDELKNEYLHV